MIGMPALLAVAACGQGAEDAAWKAQARQKAADATAEAGYVTPPTVTGLLVGPDGSLTASGQAQQGASVRLGSPTGEMVSAVADDAGQWRAQLPASDAVRLYGVSMTSGGRAVQSQGYAAILPNGRLAQLRAGSGSLLLTEPSAAPRILAVDFDRDGQAVLTGVAASRASLSVRVNRVPGGETSADRSGRFLIALNKPLPNGPVEIEVAGDGGVDTVTIIASQAGPIAQGPFRSAAIAGGWRIDWMSPGGGVQTTLLLAQR